MPGTYNLIFSFETPDKCSDLSVVYRTAFLQLFEDLILFYENKLRVLFLFLLWLCRGAVSAVRQIKVFSVPV